MKAATYAEMRAFLIGTGCPIEAEKFMAEGIYWFATQYKLDYVLQECPWSPGPSDLMLSSESVASLVFDMLEAEYCKPTREQFHFLLAPLEDTGKLPEDKDLYDKEKE